MNAAKPSVALVRRIKAPAIRIYEAWTDPLKLVRWWAPPGIVAVLGVEADVRVGGAYTIRMRGADGVEYAAHGVYRELQPPEKLVFSWALVPGSGRRSSVTVALRTDGDLTELTLTHEGDADPATWAERRRGWGETLDRLERELG